MGWEKIKKYIKCNFSSPHREPDKIAFENMDACSFLCKAELVGLEETAVDNAAVSFVCKKASHILFYLNT